MKSQIDCVMPAAGASSRMGAWKPLLPWGDSVIIEATLAAALEVAARVIVVAGFRGDELRARLKDRERVLVVDNPDWRLGMLGSIQRGAAFVDTEAFFSIPADMPLAKPQHFRRLLERSVQRHAEGLPEAVLFAAYGEELGHPVLIPSRLLESILSLDPRGKLRAFLVEGEHEAVDQRDPAVLADLDKPDEYEAARKSIDLPADADR